MSPFAIVFLCIQACLVQNVYSQYLGAYGPAIAPASVLGPGPYGPAAYAPAAPFGYPATGYPGVPGLAPYGGAGEGNVAVAGELPVAGNTAVAGQVPIMGAVNFGGQVPAAGAVSISGNCACGCGSPYVY